VIVFTFSATFWITLPVTGSTQPKSVFLSLFLCFWGIWGCFPFSPHLYETVAVFDRLASSSKTITLPASRSSWSFF
jgi:hypothetical protein